MASKGLATSNTRWGLSCVVMDEAAMGVILGHMKLFGATDIGFQPLGPVRKTRAPATTDLRTRPSRAQAGQTTARPPSRNGRAEADS
jgi:hypothetical protein